MTDGRWGHLGVAAGERDVGLFPRVSRVDHHFEVRRQIVEDQRQGALHSARGAR